MDSLTGLKVFRAVVESDSFAAAAVKLGLSRAAVTKHVNRLESRLRVRLLERTTRSLRLTEPGSRYYEQCAQILEQLEEAEREVTQSRANPTGTLRVNAPHSFASAHIAPFIAEFLQLHPELKLDISLTDRVVDLIEEGHDLAIRIAADLPPSSLVARPLAPCRLVVCGAPSYFERHPEPHTPDELAQHSCLIYTASQRPTEWTFVCPKNERHVVRVSGRLSTNSGDMLPAAVLSGAGLMAMPTYLVGAELRTGRLRAVLIEYRMQELTVFALYPSRKFLPLKVKAFVDFLAGKYGAEPYWDDWLRSQPTATANACAPASVSLELSG
ncbi:MAG: hypothetical protein A3I00_04335 [Betaproteobacteria bacterium RIFCSPLOWO2_02_FULL_64_12]|nr:MAG: hypothetical protein A3I00_04335 [Betaproteobacteria bacterium RIFCSPLOWO2_02_FULL_64_12]